MLLAGIFAGWIQRLQPFLRRCLRRALSLSAQNRDSILVVARRGELNRVLLQHTLPLAMFSFTSHGCKLLWSKSYRALSARLPSALCLFFSRAYNQWEQFALLKSALLCFNGCARWQACLWRCVSIEQAQNGL